MSFSNLAWLAQTDHPAATDYVGRIVRWVLALLPRARISRANPILEDEREGRVPARDAPLSGEAMLSAVTAAMIALHEQYHHRQPVTAKTLLLGDDMLACVLSGV